MYKQNSTSSLLEYLSPVTAFLKYIHSSLVLFAVQVHVRSFHQLLFTDKVIGMLSCQPLELIWGCFRTIEQRIAAAVSVIKKVSNESGHDRNWTQFMVLRGVLQGDGPVRIDGILGDNGLDSLKVVVLALFMMSDVLQQKTNDPANL